MSAQTQSNSQQTIVIALVVVAVLLASIVGILVYQQSQNAKIAQQGVPTTSDTGAQAPAGMAAQTAPPGPFDPATATKVPAGMTPVAFVKAYNEAVIAGKYDVAYKMLPIDKQKSYGDAASYASQLKGYGITSYKIGTPTQTADTLSVAAVQINPAMPITYTWNFRKVGSQWYVESRVMGGTVQ